MKRMLLLIAVIGSSWACDTSLPLVGPEPLVQAPTVPSTPNPAPSTPAPSPEPPAGPSTATLVISSFDLQYWALLANNVHSYYPNLVLRETAGVSRASIRLITITAAGRTIFWLKTAETPGCLTPPGNDVPAGGTWNIDQVYLYCVDVNSNVLL